MNEIELKPCPFCGGEAKQHLSVLSWVECKNCGAKTLQYQFDNQSIDAWNNRASSWIPVSERLPEKGKLNPNVQDYQQYMCLVDFRGIKDARALGFSKNGKWLNGGVDMTRYVIAWQPLPEPYKGVSNEI